MFYVNSFQNSCWVSGGNVVSELHVTIWKCAGMVSLSLSAQIKHDVQMRYFSVVIHSSHSMHVMDKLSDSFPLCLLYRRLINGRAQIEPTFHRQSMIAFSSFLMQPASPAQKHNEEVRRWTGRFALSSAHWTGCIYFIIILRSWSFAENE